MRASARTQPVGRGGNVLVLSALQGILEELERGLRIVPRQHLELRLHQEIAQAVLVPLPGGLLRPGLQVRDAGRGEGVGGEILRRLSGVALRRLQLLQERGHRPRVVTGANERLKTYPVGFLLGFATEVERRLNRRAERRRRGRLPQIGRLRSEHDGGHDTGEDRNAGALLLLEAPGDVALGDVRHLVGDDRGELSFRIGARDEPGVDPDVAAGSGKGVDVVRGHHEEVEGLPGKCRSRPRDDGPPIPRTPRLPGRRRGGDEPGPRA